MTLLASEKWQQGFVVNTSSGGVALTSSLSGAKFSEGFLRDADGRLVVTHG